MIYMALKKEDIINLCSKNLRKFEDVVKELNYEIKGIFNSEMLMFISIVDYFKPKLIIESGRARGYSTKIISEFFKNTNFRIHSIEYNKYTKDSIIAMKRLSKYRNLKFTNCIQS